MKINKLFLVAFVSAIFLASCSKDEIEQPPRYVPKGGYDSGVLVMNQGSASSSMSWISFDLQNVQNDIFAFVNGNANPFGKFAQDIIFKDEKAFCTMGGSAKVQIFNRFTMASIGAISTNLLNPRYMVIVNNKLYVSNFGDYNNNNVTDDYISVFDVNTYAFIKKIDVPGGSADKMIVNAGKIYLAQGGDSGTGDNIKVIDTASDTVIKTILVGTNPNGLEIFDNFLWVMCAGESSYPVPANESTGLLIKINLTTDALANSYVFPKIYTNPTDTNSQEIFQHPKNFGVNNGFGYYTIDSKLYKLNLTPIAPATSLAMPGTVIVANAGVSPNAVAIKTNKIYVADASSYLDPCPVRIYSLGGSQDIPTIGTLLKTQTVGIGPAGFYFNQ